MLYSLALSNHFEVRKLIRFSMYFPDTLLILDHPRIAEPMPNRQHVTLTPNPSTKRNAQETKVKGGRKGRERG